eukprot:gene7455-8278_t
MAAENILSHAEADMYIEALQTVSVSDIGNQRWRTQHEYIEKLNMQAVLNASTNTEEFIQEALISHNKVRTFFCVLQVSGQRLRRTFGIGVAVIMTLIYDLISVELWQNRVFKHILDIEITSNSSLPIYMVLFHEATSLSLLETVLYHKEPCECAGDNILDLVDYCCRKITSLIIRAEKERNQDPDDKVRKNPSVKEELERQAESITFNVCLKAISLFSYITDHMHSLSLSVMTRILNTHDMPCLLVNLLEISPWKRITREGKVQMFVNKEWSDLSASESIKLQKIEGQIWITLYRLLMSEEAQRKYEFTNHRKNTILKLRKFLNEALIDQIPHLADMQRYLEELSIMETPSMKKELIIEQVPEIRDALERKFEGKWKDIAEYQMKEYFSPSDVEMKDQAMK